MMSLIAGVSFGLLAGVGAYIYSINPRNPWLQFCKLTFCIGICRFLFFFCFLFIIYHTILVIPRPVELIPQVPRSQASGDYEKGPITMKLKSWEPMVKIKDFTLASKILEGYSFYALHAFYQGLILPTQFLAIWILCQYILVIRFLIS